MKKHLLAMTIAMAVMITSLGQAWAYTVKFTNRHNQAAEVYIRVRALDLTDVTADPKDIAESFLATRTIAPQKTVIVKTGAWCPSSYTIATTVIKDNVHHQFDTTFKCKGTEYDSYEESTWRTGTCCWSIHYIITVDKEALKIRINKN